MFCPNFRRKQAVEAAKHPTTTTTFIITISRPCRRQKKLTLIAPPNNDKCPGLQFFPLNRTSHRHNAWPRNGHPQQPWPNFEDKYRTMIFPTGGRTVSYGSLNRQTGNSKTFPLGLCLPFLPSHSVCCTQLSPQFNSPFTTAYIAPR